MYKCLSIFAVTTFLQPEQSQHSHHERHPVPPKLPWLFMSTSLLYSGVQNWTQISICVSKVLSIEERCSPVPVGTVPQECSQECRWPCWFIVNMVNLLPSRTPQIPSWFLICHLSACTGSCDYSSSDAGLCTSLHCTSWGSCQPVSPAYWDPSGNGNTTIWETSHYSQVFVYLIFPYVLSVLLLALFISSHSWLISTVSQEM